MAVAVGVVVECGRRKGGKEGRVAKCGCGGQGEGIEWGEGGGAVFWSVVVVLAVY